LLSALLDALDAQRLPRDRWECIVAFDGAPPDAAAALRLERSSAVSVTLAPRRGPGAARNAGAGRARGVWLAFTEDDCVPAPDWLEALVARIARQADADVVEGATLLPSGAPARRRPDGEPTWLPTNLIVRRSLFERVGGFDERYFNPKTGAYFREDSDFGFTLEAAGAIVVVEPGARVVHPDEHPRFLDPIRWARRYEMDPLLARRHPAKARERIEVATFGPFRVRRVIVRSSLAYLVALGAAVSAWMFGEEGLAALFLFTAAVALIPLAVKWKFRPAHLILVPLVPFVQAAAFWRGYRVASRTTR
jgi:GT2 family glycosyltransferase